jgi:hypothetical protein
VHARTHTHTHAHARTHTHTLTHTHTHRPRMNSLPAWATSLLESALLVAQFLHRCTPPRSRVSSERRALPQKPRSSQCRQRSPCTPTHTSHQGKGKRAGVCVRGRVCVCACVCACKCVQVGGCAHPATSMTRPAIDSLEQPGSDLITSFCSLSWMNSGSTKCRGASHVSECADRITGDCAPAGQSVATRHTGRVQVEACVSGVCT